MAPSTPSNQGLIFTSARAQPETAEPPHRPTVGRIVHYHANRERKGQPYPAIITHVWSRDCVNLKVLTDGSFPVEYCTPTSVLLGTGDGQWSWPERTD